MTWKAAKPLKPHTIAEKKKEEPKKAAAAKPKEEPKKKEEKPKDNVASLPPSDFDLYSFKTFYTNHKDQGKTGVDEMYKMIDWKGWAFWKFEYDIYEGEGAQEHVANNLMNGIGEHDWQAAHLYCAACYKPCKCGQLSGPV